ncbi:MAG: M23 family metallopeptidase [Anaerolineae bacterium]|nr:M23 family metallopeptidase [Anaerolineae bacterium]
MLFGKGKEESARRVNISPLPTANTSGTPIAPFSALDPYSTSALLNSNPLSNPNSLPVQAAGIPPIGIYLPGAQGTALEFEALPTPENNVQTNINSEAAGSAVLLEYAGDGCAPAGMPVSGILTQRYHNYHNAIDIGVPVGTAVVATHSGEVIFAGWSTVGYGYLVIIENGPFITYYAHLSNFNVKAGDEIGAGSVIAWSGSTGNSTGPHLHYETRINDTPVDPLTFEQRGYASC